MFTWSARLDRQCVDPLSGNIAQRRVDHALPLKSRDTVKSFAFDHNGEVRFAAAIVTGMPVVQCAVIDNIEVGGMKRCAQQFFHFLSYRTSHELNLGVPIALVHDHLTVRGSD